MSTESAAVPPHDCVRLDEGEGIPPSPPHPHQRDPEQLIARLQPRPWLTPPEHRELVSESEVLHRQVPP